MKELIITSNELELSTLVQRIPMEYKDGVRTSKKIPWLSAVSLERYSYERLEEFLVENKVKVILNVGIAYSSSYKLGTVLNIKETSFGREVLSAERNSVPGSVLASCYTKAELGLRSSGCVDDCCYFLAKIANKLGIYWFSYKIVSDDDSYSSPIFMVSLMDYVLSLVL